MKLKNGVKVNYDDLTKTFEFELDKAKVGKVTSRLFPILLGKNHFNGVGWGVLDRCKMLEKEDIDPYYMVRGAIGEIFVNEYIIDTYKKYGMKDITTKHFDVVQENYDMFKKNDKFGGVVDIGISSPEIARAVVEVKSKSMKDYVRINDEKKYPIEEVMQGEYLSYLSKVNKLIMAYIFFTDKQETDIKNAMNTTQNEHEIIKMLHLKFNDFTYHMAKFEIDRDKISNQMETAYENLHRTVKNNAIHESFFNKEEVEYLYEQTNYITPNPNLENDDTPF